MSKPKQPKHHKFRESGGEFDEVFVEGASIHIERMSETGFWIGINPPKSSGLPQLMVNTGVNERGWYFNLYEDCMDGGKDFKVERPSRKRIRYDAEVSK